MRVITGSARGRKLKELDGFDIRPTTDRVKEGLFSAIQFEIPNADILDLFAGTGQLGIECLSRGAKSAVFVDQSQAAAAVIRDNLKNTNLTDRARVYTGDALSFLSKTAKNLKFDLIFLDPPYESDLISQAMRNIAAFDILKPRGIIIVERPAAKIIPPAPDIFRASRSYKYGKIAVTLYQYSYADNISNQPENIFNHPVTHEE